MFTIHKRNLGDVTPFEYLPIKEGQIAQLGCVYKVEGGKAEKAQPTDKPSYLCAGIMRKDGLAPMIKIMSDIELGTTSDEMVPRALVGAQVTLSADAAQVTATTTDGVFTLSGTGDEIGSTITGYFNK